MTFGADSPAFSGRHSLASLVTGAPAPMEPAPGAPAAPANVEKKVEEETQQAVDAKASMAAPANPALATASSAVKSMREQDGVQLTADALKLSAETLAKHTPAANSLNAGGQIITGLNKAVQGDAFGAASAASAATEKIAPQLAKSGVGAIASAVILGTGDKPLEKSAKAVQTGVRRVIAPHQSGSQRLKAAFDLTIATQNFAVLGRTLANAVLNIGRYGLKLVGKVPAFAPQVAGVRTAAGTFVKTPFGRALGFLNKWIPLLNVAGVAISAKTAIDVFRHGGSTTTKGLSLLSLGTAGLALWAGFASGGLVLIGVVAASIAADLMLAAARKRDAASGDMDAQSARWLTHPHEAAAALGGWVAHTIPAIGRSAIRLLDRTRQRLFGVDRPAAADPGRALT